MAPRRLRSLNSSYGVVAATGPTARALVGLVVLQGGLACSVSKVTGTESHRTANSDKVLSSTTSAEQPYRRPEPAVIRSRLSDLEYYVTQDNGTERPHSHPYNKQKAKGIYVDIVSGEPLFSSEDKFDSGTGWPSFTKPLVKSHVVELRDASHGMVRTEVRSRYANSHLGHVFPDGPAPTGLRYCINGAALRFVPADQLAQQGYGAYADLF